MARIAKALTLLLLAWPLAVQAGGASRLELKKRLWGVGEVRVVDGAGAKTLERFATPHLVRSAELSPDGRFALVWHHAERPPLVLSVYEVRSATKLVEFVPGYGGDLQFTPRSNIVHLWGCGSNCHAFAVYDLQGRTVVSDTVSGLEASPDRRMLVTFPSLFDAEEGIVVYDLETGNREFATDRALNGAFVGEEVRWLAGKIEIGLSDRGGVSRRLLIERTSAGRLRGSFPDGRPTRVPRL